MDDSTSRTSFFLRRALRFFRVRDLLLCGAIGNPGPAPAVDFRKVTFLSHSFLLTLNLPLSLSFFLSSHLMERIEDRRAIPINILFYCLETNKLTHSGRARRLRSKTQNLGLISKPDAQNNFFLVRGSTGNQYQVRIGHICTCSCPDFIRRQQNCKHIYFVRGKHRRNTSLAKSVLSIKTASNVSARIGSIFSRLVNLSKLDQLYKPIRRI